MLRRHQPDHLMLRCARRDASSGLLDVARLGQLLDRIRGKILHNDLPRVSPFAVPVMLEIGRERVGGALEESILAENESELVAEALWLEGAVDEVGEGSDRLTRSFSVRESARRGRCRRSPASPPPNPSAAA